MPDERRHPDRDWLTVEEVADMFGCSEDVVYRRINSGKLKALKMGGWRIHRDAIRAFARLALPRAVDPFATACPAGVRDDLGLWTARDRK